MAVETSVIIVNYRADQQVVRLKAALQKLPHSEIIVIDNSNGRKGYGAGCNQGAKQARGQHLVFLNPDLETTPADIDRLVAVLQKQPDVGLVGPQIRRPDGTIEISCSAIPTPLMALVEYSRLRYWPLLKCWSDAYRLYGFDHRTSRCVPTIGGCCLAMRKSDWQVVGGFDEKLFLYFEEFDLAKRLRDQLNKTAYFCAEATIIHLGQVSTKQITTAAGHFRQSRRYWLSKAYGWLGRVTAGLLELGERAHA